MKQSSTLDWECPNILDNVDFQEADVKEFMSLLGKTETSKKNIEELIQPGNIILGKIVEITKDFAVVDVGLKSEGLIPVSEFSNPIYCIFHNYHSFYALSIFLIYYIIILHIKNSI